MEVLLVITVLGLATHSGAPLAAPALILAAALATTLHAAAREARRRFSPGSCLRRCPLCGSDAVDWWSQEEIDLFRERIELHCASCGVSRRVVSPVWAVSAYGCRYQRDREKIGSALRRTEHRRLRHETDAFRAILEREVVGADDFLAATRPRSGR